MKKGGKIQQHLQMLEMTHAERNAFTEAAASSEVAEKNIGCCYVMLLSCFLLAFVS